MKNAPKTTAAIQAAIQAARDAGQEELVRRLQEIADRLRASNDNAPQQN